MAAPPDTRSSRDDTNQCLHDERDRADEELLSRSDALAEDADEIICVARERARIVLELARGREDEHLRATAAPSQVRTIVLDQRRIEDEALDAEHHVADEQRFDERERRRLAMIELLAYERGSTDRMLATERAVTDRSAGAREDVLAVLAHDLRGLLGTILVNASVILLAPDLETATRPAAGIQRAGAQMGQILEDLLDASRIEAGRLTLSRASIDLVQLARDALAIHELLAKTRGVVLAMTSSPPSLTLQADGQRLTRVLINLVGNALKFTPAGGTVAVTIELDDDECELTVRDTGIGIPEDQLERIFERFEQVDRTASTSSGIGLGLFIARRIVEAHGGRIRAESVAGAGATFRVRLPLGRQ